jgi:hypothetical protein
LWNEFYFLSLFCRSAWWYSGGEALVVRYRLVMSIVAWSLLLLLLLATPCLVWGAEEVQNLHLENCVGDLFDDAPQLHGVAIGMASTSSLSASPNPEF